MKFIKWFLGKSALKQVTFILVCLIAIIFGYSLHIAIANNFIFNYSDLLMFIFLISLYSIIISTLYILDMFGKKKRMCDRLPEDLRQCCSGVYIQGKSEDEVKKIIANLKKRMDDASA